MRILLGRTPLMHSSSYRHCFWNIRKCCLSGNTVQPLRNRLVCNQHSLRTTRQHRHCIYSATPNQNDLISYLRISLNIFCRLVFCLTTLSIRFDLLYLQLIDPISDLRTIKNPQPIHGYSLTFRSGSFGRKLLENNSDRCLLSTWLSKDSIKCSSIHSGKTIS